MTAPATSPVWSGRWVADRLGVRLDGPPELSGLLGLAIRDNPKRAHLLVSNVLGKHVPQRPAVVHRAGTDLGRRVRALLGPTETARAAVLGYAETATALGHAVADGLGTATCLHSTRRPVPGLPATGCFEEAHSHATSHLLLPEDPRLLDGDGPLVLVDDEFSTGNTVLNTISALHTRHPRRRYVVVLAELGVGPTSSTVADLVLSVTDYACERLSSLGAVLLSPREGEHRSGIVTFQIPGQDPAEIRKALLSIGIVTSCRGGGVRISPHGYATREEIDRLADVLSNMPTA